jgi:hypothetical protein
MDFRFPFNEHRISIQKYPRRMVPHSASETLAALAFL